MSEPVLTSQQYLELDKGICPYCGSRELMSNGRSFNHDEHGWTRAVNCQSCRTSWFEHSEGFSPR